MDFNEGRRVDDTQNFLKVDFRSWTMKGHPPRTAFLSREDTGLHEFRDNRPNSGGVDAHWARKFCRALKSSRFARARK